jgi:hypothetical protein
MNRALDWPRTSYLPLTRRMLYQMSYKGAVLQTHHQLPEQDSNLHLRDPESRVLPIRRPGIEYGRRDLNSHELTLTRV